MGNLIVILLLIVAVGILTFNARPTSGYTPDQNAQLAAAYKNKADAFEGLNSALHRQVEAQEKLLDAYGKRISVLEHAKD